MSDLNERISAWRAALGERLGSKSAAELEDHLRTIIESLANTGLPDDERLLVASHRLGHPDALSTEFAKNDPFAIWRGRLAWMLVGLVPLQLLLAIVRDVLAKVGTTSLNWGWPVWAAALAMLFPQVLILLAVLGSCVWAGKATQPLRWTAFRWLPSSFSGLVSMLVVVVIAFTLLPIIVSQYRGWGADAAHISQFQDLHIVYGIGWSSLDLAFHITAAVLIAWLIVPRRVEAENVHAN